MREKTNMELFQTVRPAVDFGTIERAALDEMFRRMVTGDHAVKPTRPHEEVAMQQEVKQPKTPCPICGERYFWRDKSGGYVHSFDPLGVSKGKVCAAAPDIGLAVAAAIQTDPELAAWSSQNVRESIAYTREDCGDEGVYDGPTLHRYRVAFMYPEVEMVTAFTASEAVALAILQLNEGTAIHNPQVESVTLIPWGQDDDPRHLVAQVEDGRVIDVQEV